MLKQIVIYVWELSLTILFNSLRLKIDGYYYNSFSWIQVFTSTICRSYVTHFVKSCLYAQIIFFWFTYKSLVLPLIFHIVYHSMLHWFWFWWYSKLMLLLREWSFEKIEKLITCRLHMHYLELTEFHWLPQDALQKKAVFKLLAWSAGINKRFQTSFNGKATIGD